MAKYPFLVDVAWQTTGQLIREWQQEEYRWETEIDFQIELVGRLSAINNLLGTSTIVMPNGAKKARIVCEPSTYYSVENERTSWCKPDVAIRPDCGDDNDDTSGGRLMWACEIKYEPYKKSDDDAVKLRKLIKEGLADHACWIRLWRETRESNSLSINKDTECDRLWIYDAWPQGRSARDLRMP